MIEYDTPETKAANAACRRADDDVASHEEMTAVFAAERALESANLRQIAGKAYREYSAVFDSLENCPMGATEE